MRSDHVLFMTVFSFCVAGFISCAVPKDMREGATTGKSPNWEVTIVKAAKYSQPREDPTSPGRYLEPPVYGRNCYNVALDLRFTYKGPPGEIQAPSISATDESGTRYGALGHIANISVNSGDVDAMGWLVTLARNDPEKRPLKSGERFGADDPITFYLGDIPLTSSELKIIFADVAPIPVKLVPLQ